MNAHSKKRKVIPNTWKAFCPCVDIRISKLFKVQVSLTAMNSPFPTKMEKKGQIFPVQVKRIHVCILLCCPCAMTLPASSMHVNAHRKMVGFCWHPCRLGHFLPDLMRYFFFMSLLENNLNKTKVLAQSGGCGQILLLLIVGLKPHFPNTPCVRNDLRLFAMPLKRMFHRQQPSSRTWRQARSHSPGSWFSLCATLPTT